MVSKRRTHKRFSFSVRMKRSAAPLPSGSRTKLGEQYERDQRRLAGQVERLEEQVRQLAGQYAREQPAVGLTCNDIDQRIRGTFEECKRNDQRLQRCCEGYERTHALIHGEAEQKREAGDRRDRVEGRIENLIQGRARSRWHGPSR